VFVVSQQARVNALLDLQGHHHLEEFLLTSDFEVDKRSIGTTNKVHPVSEHGSVVAVFKPRDGVSLNAAKAYDQTKNSVVLSECVAWQVARLLGDPFAEIVAPCVLRKLNGLNGAVAHWRPGSSPDATCQTSAPEQCRAAAFFDAVVGQQDRNDFNYLWDLAETRLSLIDHGFAFARKDDRRNASIFCAWRHAEDDPALSAEELEALAHFAEPAGGVDAIRACLEPARADALEVRVSEMLASGQLLQALAFAP
jgi:hypothetical protein